MAGSLQPPSSRAYLLHTCLVALALVISPLNASVTPAIVQDGYGNLADSKSIITWAALPSGTPYQTNVTYDAGSLAMLYQYATQFVSVCIPGVTPWALFMGIIQKTTAFSQDVAMKLLQWAYGYAASIVVGVLFIVFSPLVGMCFCCCRTCCKKCGGKMVQERKGSYKCFRVFYVLGLAVCSVFLGVGMVCTYYTNQTMATSIPKIGGIIDSNFDDIQAYLDNTVMQIQYTANQGFNFTSKVIYRDLDNAGELIGTPVHDQFAANYGLSAAFSALLSMDSLLSSMVTSLTSVNNSIANVKGQVTNLQAALSSLQGNLSDHCTSLSATTGGIKNCSTFGIDPSKLTIDFNPSSLPDFGPQLAQLKAVQAQNITALVLNGQNQFDNISNIVAANAAPTMTNLKNQISGFSGTISSSLASLTDKLSSVGNISSYGQTINGYLQKASDYEKYRWYAGVGLTCTVLLVLVFQLLGLIFACCACLTDSNKLPTERGSCGNCGGCCLMASVGFAFMFGWLLMILVFITFLLGAPLNKVVCQSVRDPDLVYLQELVDGGPGKLSLLSQTEGYALGQLILSNASVPLTFSGLLKSCKNGASAWNALYLSSLIDLNSITNYKSQINVNDSINNMNVDLSSLTLLDSTTRDQMSSMATNIENINFTGLIDVLSRSTVVADMTELAILLKNVSVTTNQSSFADDANSVTSIQNNQVALVRNAQASMLSSIQSLSAVAAPVPGNITALLSQLNTTQTLIQTNGVNVIKSSSLTFANRILATADQFVTFALNALQTGIGQCTPVWTLYQSMFDVAICGYFVDILDAFWFSLGWCVAFFVPSMIFATKLAKHVRKMDSLSSDDHETNFPRSARSSRISIRHHKVKPA